MSFDRVRAFCQSLRFRLTLWNTVLILAVVLVNLLAVREGLRWTLSRMVDSFLTEELTLAVDEVKRLGLQSAELRAELDIQATSHTRRRLFIQLLDERKTVAWASKQSPPAGLVPSDPVARDSPVTLGDLRIVGRDVRLGDGRVVTVRVGCTLERARSELEHFTSRLVEVALVLLLVAPLGGYLLAGRATRPVARIISTTTRLHPTELDERLPIRGTRDELDQLSQTINNFLDRIAAYVRQSREFTANAAHELRSPLTALQNSVEVALNADRTTDEYKELLSVLLEECGQMRILVNQLLLLAEGDAGRLRLNPQPVRLDQLVTRSVEMFRAVAEAAGVELTARRVDPAVIQGDGTRLWQVVNNLLDNAIKFTPAGGRITVALLFEGGGNPCVLEVSDTGVGIPAEDLPHVFERFYQGDKARDRETFSRGVGLGLSICQAIVSAHGGTIEAASRHGEGTTFTVRLPDCTRPDPAETDPGPGERSAPERSEPAAPAKLAGGSGGGPT